MASLVQESLEAVAEGRTRDKIIAINSPSHSLYDYLWTSSSRQPAKMPGLKRYQLLFLIELLPFIKIHIGIKTNILSLQEVNQCRLLQ